MDHIHIHIYMVDTSVSLCNWTPLSYLCELFFITCSVATLSSDIFSHYAPHKSRTNSTLPQCHFDYLVHLCRLKLTTCQICSDTQVCYIEVMLKVFCCYTSQLQFGFITVSIGLLLLFQWVLLISLWSPLWLISISATSASEGLR